MNLFRLRPALIGARPLSYERFAWGALLAATAFLLAAILHPLLAEEPDATLPEIRIEDQASPTLTIPPAPPRPPRR